MDNITITETGKCFSIIVNTDAQEFSYLVDNVADELAAAVKLSAELKDIDARVQIFIASHQPVPKP